MVPVRAPDKKVNRQPVASVAKKNRFALHHGLSTVVAQPLPGTHHVD